MAIQDRNLQPGTTLVARYHKIPYTCEVIDGGDGKLRYRLADGKEYKSPSAAGMAITGKACNGWAFWSLEQEAAPAETATEADVDADAEAEPAGDAAEEPVLPVSYRIYKTPNQKGVPEGQVRWHCDGCAGSFLAPSGEKPQACPYQHQAA